MAELVVSLILIRILPNGSQRKVAGAADWILQPLGAHATEFISETEVYVVKEAGSTRPVVLNRIEGLHDVLVASLSMLRNCG